MADDEPFNISALLGIMRVLGLKNADELVDTCYNGQNLVDYVKKAVEEDDYQRYSLILTDCQMPIMDGYQATAGIINSDTITHPIYISAFTATARQEDRDACNASGMHDFVAKPALPSHIFEVVKRAHNWLEAAN